MLMRNYVTALRLLGSGAFRLEDLGLTAGSGHLQGPAQEVRDAEAAGPVQPEEGGREAGGGKRRSA